MKIALAATAALALALPAAAHPDEPDRPAGRDAPAPAQTVEGMGQIKSVDAKAGAITIHHAPIAALGWPAMTMTFKASPEALRAAKAGQRVRFTLQTSDNQVVAIRSE